MKPLDLAILAVAGYVGWRLLQPILQRDHLGRVSIKDSQAIAGVHAVAAPLMGASNTTGENEPVDVGSSTLGGGDVNELSVPTLSYFFTTPDSSGGPVVGQNPPSPGPGKPEDNSNFTL